MRPRVPFTIASRRDFRKCVQVFGRPVLLESGGLQNPHRGDLTGYPFLPIAGALVFFGVEAFFTRRGFFATFFTAGFLRLLVV